MEKLLSLWIHDEIERNMPSNQAVLMQKARKYLNHIQLETADTNETIIASRGWFISFKHRNHLRNIKITGEAASGDVIGAAQFTGTLETIIE